MTDTQAVRTATHPALKRLSAAEAEQALYIDFEGAKDKPPVLLGTLNRGGRGPNPFVFQVVVDHEFRAVGTEERAFKDAIRVVVQRAEAGDRRIVAWSRHELDVVRELLPDEPELVARFESRYANALSVAKRWASKLYHEAKPAKGELGAYLAMIEYEVPPGGGPGHVGDTIRALRPALVAGRPLTPRQKARWTRLLKHNQHDCAGMKAVCLRATRELASSRSSERGRSAHRPNRRSDVYLSSLREYVEALGGELEVNAVFDGVRPLRPGYTAPSCL